MSQMSYTTPEYQNQSNISSTITLPSGAKVKSVTVNTGSVTFTQSGNQLNISCTGGAAERSSNYSYNYDCTASPATTSASGQQFGTRYNYEQWNGSSWVFSSSSGTEPSSISYNDGSYSGSLSKNSVSYGTPTYYSAPSNPSVGQTYNNSATSWQAFYSGTVNAIPKTCTSTGTNYFYQYLATVIYDLGRFSRFYGVSHYGRGKRGAWST